MLYMKIIIILILSKKIRGNENALLDDLSFEKKFYYTILHVIRKKILYDIQNCYNKNNIRCRPRSTFDVLPQP